MARERAVDIIRELLSLLSFTLTSIAGREISSGLNDCVRHLEAVEAHPVRLESYQTKCSCGVRSAYCDVEKILYD
jgi:hypothetical protein